MDQRNVSSSTPRNFTELCLVSTDIISNPYFRLILFISIIESIIAAILNIFLMLIIGKTKIFHTNLRLLLFHHSLNLTLYAVGIGIKEIYMFTVQLVWNDPCRLITSLFNCKLQETFYIIPLVNGIYSLMILCLERFYATIKYRTYDQHSSNSYLAYVLIFLAWMIVVINQSLPFLEIPRNVYMPICANLLTVTVSSAKLILIPNTIIEVVAIVFIVVLYFINRRLLEFSLINRAKQTLTGRFQISQNVEINKLLLPTASVHGICILFQHLYLILIVIGLNLEENTKIILIHLNYSLALSYAIAHPIFAFWKNSHLRKHLRDFKILAKLLGDRKVDPEFQNSGSVRANRHFNVLEEMWNRPIVISNGGTMMMRGHAQDG